LVRWKRHIHEFTFALNLAVAPILAVAVYLNFVLPAFEGGDNFVYYLFRSMVRANDWFGLAAERPSVSMQSHPELGSMFGKEIAWFVPLLGFTLLLFCCVRALRQSNWYPLGPLSGFAAAFALPIAFVVVLKIAWEFKPRLHGSLSLSSEPIVVFFGAELVAAIILIVLHRKWPLSWLPFAMLMTLHYAIWLPQIWSHLRMFDFYGMPDNQWLIAVAPLAGLSWLLGRNISREAEPPSASAQRILCGATTALVAMTFALWTPLPARPRGAPSVLVLQRSYCFGSCPAYQVTIRDSGEVEFDNFKTKQSGVPITPDQFRALIKELDEVGFRRLEDRAFSWCFDTPHVSIEMVVADERKRVVSDAGCTGAPSSRQSQFVRAASRIDEVIGTREWLRTWHQRWR
jgi:hypothetical protein